MEDFLDSAWNMIATGLQWAGDNLYIILEQFHFLGPAVVISLLAFLAVAITKVLSRVVVTKRYVALEKEYHHWFQLRQQALQCEDRQKGRGLARNIDQAELNRAYYDYFFEGLLLGIARRVIPIFFVFAFINEYYRPVRLVESFGREYVLKIAAADGPATVFGAPFWFFLSLVGFYILWAVVGFFVKKMREKDLATLADSVA